MSEPFWTVKVTTFDETNKIWADQTHPLNDMASTLRHIEHHLVNKAPETIKMWVIITMPKGDQDE